MLFYDQGVHTPPTSPAPPHNISDVEGDETQDGEQETIDEGPLDEEPDDQQGSSESSKTINSASTSGMSRVSRASHSTRGSTRKRITMSTPEDGAGELPSVPIELGTSMIYSLLLFK